MVRLELRRVRRISFVHQAEHVSCRLGRSTPDGVDGRSRCGRAIQHRPARASIRRMVVWRSSRLLPIIAGAAVFLSTRAVAPDEVQLAWLWAVSVAVSAIVLISIAERVLLDWRRPDNAVTRDQSSILVLWLLAAAGSVVLFAPFMAMRHILLALPPVVLLCGKAADSLFDRRWVRVAAVRAPDGQPWFRARPFRLHVRRTSIESTPSRRRARARLAQRFGRSVTGDGSGTPARPGFKSMTNERRPFARETTSSSRASSAARNCGRTTGSSSAW